VGQLCGVVLGWAVNVSGTAVWCGVRVGCECECDSCAIRF